MISINARKMLIVSLSGASAIYLFLLLAFFFEIPNISINMLLAALVAYTCLTLGVTIHIDRRERRERFIEEMGRKEEMTKQKIEVLSKMMDEQPKLIREAAVKRPIVLDKMITTQAEIFERIATKSPDLILNIARDQPSILLKMVQEQPKIIERMVNKDTKFLEKLTRDQPEIAERIVMEKPEIMENIAASRPEVIERLAVNYPAIFQRVVERSEILERLKPKTVERIRKIPKVSAEYKKPEKAEKASAFREIYPIKPPFAYSAINRDPETGGLRYQVIEPTLLPRDREYLKRIRRILFEELDVDLKSLDHRKPAEEYLEKEIRNIVKRYRLKLDEATLDKLIYYLIRDSVYYGKIDVLMKDHMIEDISCDGPNIPLYIWHREYESIPTNIKFESDEELDDYVIKLAYMSGRHISIAAPIVDASLPDGSRVQLTFRQEVTRKGSTFTIRKFRADPLTIIDLILFNTISPEAAAFFWYAVEKVSSILIVGGTASGKTTTLNALSIFIPPDKKIITIEDTAELNLPHENWISSVARTGFGVRGGEAEISLFDLLRAAMRQRPDHIIVGEVRGEEAYTLFQAMATGHGGMGSIHGESVQAAIDRLTTKPMDIPKRLILSLDLFLVQNKLRLGERTVRRVVHVAEPVSIDPATENFVINDVFLWSPETDKFTYTRKSKTLEKISTLTGISLEEISAEIEMRKTVLNWMVKRGVRRQSEVAEIIRNYYANPSETYESAKLGLYE